MVNTRIKSLRKELDLTQQEFAKKIGSSQNTLANYEIGRRNPSSSVINNICKTFNVNEVWLRTGNGEMFNQSSPDEEISHYVKELLSDWENPFYGMIIDMMKTYQMLDEKSKEVIRDFFQKIKDSRTIAPAAPLPTVEEAEADYIKNVLGSAQNTDSAISSSTEDVKKVSGE